MSRLHSESHDSDGITPPQSHQRLLQQNLPDADKAVAEMKRVVKPQGTVAAYMWDALGGGFVQRPPVEALGAMGIDVPPATGRKNSSIGEMRSLFERAGLDQIAARTIEIEVSYPNFDD